MICQVLLDTFPLECQAPVTVDVYAIALRLAPKAVEVETWKVQLRQRCRTIENVQAAAQAVRQVGFDPATIALQKETRQRLVSERLDHTGHMASDWECVKQYLTRHDRRRFATNPRAEPIPIARR